MIKLFHEIRRNFALRMVLLLTLAMIVMAGIFDLIFIRIQEKSFEEQIMQNGLSLVNMIADTVTLAVFAEDKEGLEGPVHAILKQKDVEEVVIFNAEGDFLIEKNRLGSELPFYVHEGIKTIMARVNFGTENWQTEENFVFMTPVFFEYEFDGEDALYFDELKEMQRERIGYVALVLSKKGFHDKVAQILIRTGVIVSLFLFLGIFFIAVLLNSLTKPLRDLLGKMSRKAGEKSNIYDLHLLKVTFDSMIAELDQSFETIHELKQGLEDKVAARTRELILSNTDLASHKKSLEESNRKLFDAMEELHVAQEQIIQSEKMAAIGQIVAGVAHEINNTTNFVSGALPSLKRLLHDAKKIITGYEELEACHGKEAADGKLAQIENLKKEIEYDELFETIDLLLANIEEGTSRTVRIVKDLKTFSRDDEEKRTTVDLHELINSSLKFIESELRQDIEIKKMYSDIPMMECLPGRISQVFLNIMNNSIQAMDGKGTLRVWTWHDNDNIHISFIDTGCGISKESMPRIFDPFFTSKEVGKGSGLGLGISYAIIKKHGGEIKVESEEGRGTEFEVILPKKPMLEERAAWKN